jgi:hypothetical protein
VDLGRELDVRRPAGGLQGAKDFAVDTVKMDGHAPFCANRARYVRIWLARCTN